MSRLAVGVFIVGVAVAGCSSESPATAGPETFSASGGVVNLEVDIHDLDSPEDAARRGIRCQGYRSSLVQQGSLVSLIGPDGNTLTSAKLDSGRWRTGQVGLCVSVQFYRGPCRSGLVPDHAGRAADRRSVHRERGANDAATPVLDT